MRHIPAWVNSLILPIAAGTWFQVWGLVIAAVPTQLSGALASSRVPAQVLNAIFIGPPLGFLVLCMTLSGLSDHHWTRVVTKDWPAFRDRYESETELSREMLVDAQKIWDRLLKMSLLLLVNLIAWVIAGVVIMVLHGSVVLCTVVSLRKFLTTHEAIQRRRFRKGGSSDPEHADRQSTWRFLRKQIVRICDLRDQRGTGSSQIKWEGAGRDPSRTPVDPSPEQNLPVWRSESPTEMTQMMGHQRGKKVLVYFAGQCAAVSMGGSSMVGLGIALTLTLYPAMEQQSRQPIIIFALVTISCITMSFGLVTLLSLAYSSFEPPFSAFIQANISAAEIPHRRSACANVAANNRLQSEGKDWGKAGKGQEQGSESSPGQTRGGERRPNSVCRPTPPEAIVLHMRRTNPTALNRGSASSSTTFALPPIQFSYYDQEAGAESANSYQVPESQPTTPIGTESPPSSQLQPNYPSWAPFSSYHE
ncbi:hypothetical protein A4X09_0g4307 [Tilletia walkeri]|uniref:Transmembrane protein n=1 Tax=Tilletia walkeri TaxID=117179 RepID=A0A8X7N8N6_9BASI|nr:hypothetical protein A4X09_0g4307 [Tilletia walkeri]